MGAEGLLHVVKLWWSASPKSFETVLGGHESAACAVVFLVSVNSIGSCQLPSAEMVCVKSHGVLAVRVSVQIVPSRCEYRHLPSSNLRDTVVACNLLDHLFFHVLFRAVRNSVGLPESQRRDCLCGAHGALAVEMSVQMLRHVVNIQGVVLCCEYLR